MKTVRIKQNTQAKTLPNLPLGATLETPFDKRITENFISVRRRDEDVTKEYRGP
jgi:hypothetical protein